MTLAQISPDEVIIAARNAMALPLTVLSASDEVLLAGLVRRAASIVCPCSPSTLIKVVLDHLNDLSALPEEELRSQIEDAVEKALIAGDLLELNQATTDDPKLRSTWVFAASPSFVVRPSGSIFLSGIAGDDPSPLPSSLRERIVYDRHFRKIEPNQNESLAQSLRNFGIIELSDRNWLKYPKPETASEHRARMATRLNGEAASGSVAELELQDGTKRPTYYRGRWIRPKRESGHYVARRPQAYGAALWGFALLADGALQKFLDLPLKGGRMRGSDCAWHLQMAIDACNGTPQMYRLRQHADGVLFDFFSPLPMWAERRLAIIGRTAEKTHCLFTYCIPKSEAATEEAFLQQSLWLSPMSAQEQS